MRQQEEATERQRLEEEEARLQEQMTRLDEVQNTEILSRNVGRASECEEGRAEGE